MFTARSITVEAKESADPVELFVGDTGRPIKFVKEICFYRLVGMDGSDRDYIERIRRIDAEMQKRPFIPYLRLQQLKNIEPGEDIRELAQMYDGIAAALNHPERLLACAFPLELRSETLAWTMRQAYARTLEAYKSDMPQATESMVRNVGVKLLYWMRQYLPVLYTEPARSMSVFPKLLYTGTMKKQESLLLYLLALLGCDVLYMNPEEDLRDPCGAVGALSRLTVSGAKKSCGIPIPQFCADAPVPAVPVSASVRRRDAQPPVVNITAPAPPQPHAKPSPGRELTYEELAELSCSVVMIRVLDGEGKCFKTGSGVVISEDGYILTNNHVVSGGRQFSVQFENETSDYVSDRLVKYHSDYDLALIRVERTCRHIELLRGDPLARGQKIVAIGSPLGLFNTISDGIISGFRQIDAISMVQFTAPISNGSSGGALLDMQGRLAGLITAGFDKGQNLNLAVDSATILPFIGNFLH